MAASLVNWKEIKSHMNWKRRMRSIIYPGNKLNNGHTTIAAFAKIKKASRNTGDSSDSDASNQYNNIPEVV